ncbi:alpha/beta hydrolase [Rhizosphaericola mali]|uniref:Alpha/beta hydrolase n=1 Tax=Rhizosphaericola mali TaxID=2545455 RepID=A0A5P2G409_9BACT|nr:alpha/beta hydrolase [Rhizosphaericola mali]QES90235.1 alpha/beta hydrolase [Rhizosphaericola mali]
MKLISAIFTCFLTFFTKPVKSQKIEKVYLRPKDSSTLYYCAIVPSEKKFNGILILMPEFGETPEYVLLQTNLPKLAAQNQLLTIIPILQDGVYSFGVDRISQNYLNNIIDSVLVKYHISPLKLIIGGFSIGGSTAIKYAETATIKPRAVFAIDPPLDFERFYNAAKRSTRISTNKIANTENHYMIKKLEKLTGGTPTSKRISYQDLSPYSMSDTTQKAIKPLTKIPIRIYSEPDIYWWMKNRNMDVASLNIIDGSACINELQLLGNKDARLILTTEKGFRNPNHLRHPHSWSIVENKKLIQWIIKKI